MANGAGGRPAKPLAMHKAAETYRADRHSGSVEYERGIGTCPAWLSKEAKAEWRRVVPQLKAAGVLQVTDRALLAAYCAQWALFVKLNGEIDARETASLAVKLLPYQAAAVKQLATLACQFGFSPSARTRVRGNGGDDDGAGTLKAFIAD